MKVTSICSQWLPLLLLAYCTSCSTSQREIRYVEPEQYAIDTIERSWSIDFTPKYNSGSDLLIYRDEAWSLTNQCGAGKLVLVNLDRDSVIELNLANPDCEEVHTSMNRDGIYVVLQDGRVLLYPHGSKFPQLKLNLFKDVLGFRESGLVPEWSKSGGNEMFAIRDNTLFFRVNLNLDDTLGKFSKYTVGYPISARLDMTTREMTYHGELPVFVIDQSYGYYSDVYDLYMGDSVIYTSGSNGTITVIDVRSKKERHLSRPSSYQVKKIPELKYADNLPITEYRNKKIEYSTYSAGYEPLFYNPFDRHYYRIFHPEMSKYAEDGLLHTEFDKGNVLMIFDQNLKLVDEVILPIKTAKTSRFRPTSEGVEFVLPDSGQHTVTKTKLTYKLLRVSKKYK